MALIVDPDALAQGTEVTINTGTKRITLNIAGDLTTDGVTLKCFYSFLKEQWKTDPALIKFPFPMVPITDEQFEFVNGWDLADDASRYLIRSGGWAVKNTSDVVTQMWAGIIGLGAIEPDDQLYYQQSSSGSATNVQLTGQINQAVQIYRDDDGDGNTAEGSDYDRRSYFSLFAREAAQLYGKSTLADIGVSQMSYQAYRFPIGTGTDLKVTAADAVVGASVSIASATWVGNVGTINTSAAHGLTTGDYVQVNGVTPAPWNVRGTVTVVDTDTFTIAIVGNPGAYSSGGSVKTIYSLVKVRYFNQAYSKLVDHISTARDFGIVVDVGTHSGVDGSCTSGASVLTTAAGGIVTEGNPYAGGTLVVHEGPAKGTYTISGNPTATTVTISGTFPGNGSNASFTVYPPNPVPATAEQIYTAVQYLLRQNSDIDSTAGTVTGKTADQLMYFVGDTLVAGKAASGAYPTNPNSGGSGVMIEGFRAIDTNRIQFFDNVPAQRTYPYKATLTINFGANLVNDGQAIYRVFFTNDDAADTPGGKNYGTAIAVLVKNDVGVDMAGNVGGQTSVTLTYDYDGNVQRGTGSAGEDAPITVVGLGLATGQFVSATGTIARSTANSVSLVAPLERNYSNP